MRILVTGAKGRLGSKLAACLSPQNHTVTPVDVDEMDLLDADTVFATFEQVRPELVLHCAALTAVDHCAEHPDEALAVNAFGTKHIALACQRHAAPLLYISTNEVFDGCAQRPYLEYDTPRPVNAYGYSKWVGEQIVRELLPQHYIVRTSWLFAHGGRNFVQTVLRLAREGKSLRVVTNEVSTPTYNDDLVDAIIQLINTGHFGTYHLVNEGYTTRYQFARKVLDLAGMENVSIEPIALSEFNRPSRPPEYAVIRNTAAAHLGIKLRPWEDALRAFMEIEHG